MSGRIGKEWLATWSIAAGDTVVLESAFVQLIFQHYFDSTGVTLYVLEYDRESLTRHLSMD